MDWGKIPDIIAVTLLAGAFASVARRSPSGVSRLWLTGWLLVVVHFGALVFIPLPGNWGVFSAVIALCSLSWAGVLFMWAAVPYRHASSKWMLFALLGANSFYITCLEVEPLQSALPVAAALIGLGPLVVALYAMRTFTHPLRWILVTLYLALAAFLFSVQKRPGSGEELALNGVLCVVYLSCCTHFCYRYRRATAGAFITNSGFLAWAFVFVLAPLQARYLPHVQIESEVWNLPKYVVAVGMILLLLELQIDHSEHLALHDMLTGLPNRRLFQDRLASALERARRTGTQAALLTLDLDRFKQVNDTLGHHMGDLLLQQVASIFSSRVRRSDTVARTGGDEFSVILEAPTNRDEAMHVGYSLQELVKQPIQLEDRSVWVGASIGVAIFPDDASDLEALCIAADQRMYDNKRASAALEDLDRRNTPPTQAPAKRPKPTSIGMQR